MGRAIVREPQSFLMDEPLSNLDAKLRVGMRASLAQLHAKLGITTVYVTHDQTEAMTLGTRVAVMRDGKIVQVAEPQVLYTSPVDLFVAAFIGSPAMNLVEASIDGDELRFGGHAIALDAHRRPAGDVAPHDRRHPAGGLRGRASSPRRSSRASTSRSRSSRSSGADTHVFFRVDAPRVTRRVRPRGGRRRDAPRRGAHALHGARRPAHADPGRLEHAVLAVDPRRLHFFDPGTGRAAELRGAGAALSVSA